LVASCERAGNVGLLCFNIVQVVGGLGSIGGLLERFVEGR
jgi:hypothetical protein